MGDFTAQLRTSCTPCLVAVRDCGSDEECSAASVRLQHCFAGVLCPREASLFGAAADAARSSKGADVDAAEAAYERMTGCLAAFERRRLAVKAQAP